jgi:hypothetical protein
MNYNSIYTLSLYNGLFVYCMIKRSKYPFDASLQLSQLRHLRHTYFSHAALLTVNPLHLRTVILSQKPDVSQALLLRVRVDAHLLRHNGHLLQTGRQSTQMLWHVIGSHNVSFVRSSRHTGQLGSSANLCSRVLGLVLLLRLTDTFATRHTTTC